MKIEYHKEGDYYFPNLYLDSNFKYSEISKYGRMRLSFLQEHLLEIDKTANDMFEFLMKQLAKKENITEELKAIDQLKWVGLMNNIKNSVDEIHNNIEETEILLNSINVSIAFCYVSH